MNKVIKIVTSTLATVVATLAVPVSVLAQYDNNYTYTPTDEEAAAVFAGMSLVFLIGGCLGLIITIIMTVWTYKDAKKRGNDNAVLWTVLVFIFGLIGLLVYIFTQRKDEPMAAPAAAPVQETPAPPPPPTV